MADQLDIFNNLSDRTNLDTKSFYNTINLVGTDLKEARHKVNRQEDRILEIFRIAERAMTPETVEGTYNDLFPPVPLTSIRRAITNLTTSGHLVKCDKMAMGKYGKPVHFWMVRV